MRHDDRGIWFGAEPERAYSASDREKEDPSGPKRRGPGDDGRKVLDHRLRPHIKRFERPPCLVGGTMDRARRRQKLTVV